MDVQILNVLMVICRYERIVAELEEANAQLRAENATLKAKPTRSKP